MIDFKQKMEEDERREMIEKGINLDQAEEILINNRKRNRLIIYTVSILVIALVFCGRVLMSSQSATGIFFSGLKHLVPSSDKQIKGEENDRINILLLGIGGAGHDGAYLNDTIILASLKPSTKQVSLISIPRDLVTPVSNWQKINSIGAYAEQKNPGSGGEVTAQSISQLLQIPIDYYVRVDFSAFSNIIDELGGITVDVENTLDDYSYPILGQEDNPSYYSRYEHLHIEQGVQKMDGSLALKYARSRHGLGLEGSDFARAKRQQLVLEAVKQKLLSSSTFLNPVTITKLINELNDNITTNLSVWEMLRVWELFKDVDRSQIINKVLSDAPDGLLISGQGEDGAYILTPRSGNFSDIINLVQNIFTLNQVIKIDPITDKASVAIFNGTWIIGLASKESKLLSEYNFTTFKTANAPLRNYKNTIVYDLSQGEKKQSLETLKKVSQANDATDFPAWIEELKTASSSPDFVLILGSDLK